MPPQAMIERAAQLRARGRTPLRTFRVLKHEFPNAERHEQLAAAGLGPTGIMPSWADKPGILRPVICKRDPRKVPA